MKLTLFSAPVPFRSIGTVIVSPLRLGLPSTTTCDPLIAIAKVTWALVSSPPLSVPPLSTSSTVMFAVPFAVAEGVKLRLPVVPSITGPLANKPVLSLFTMLKASV